MAAKKKTAGGSAKSTPTKTATAAKESAPNSKVDKQAEKSASKKSGAQKAAAKKKDDNKKDAADSVSPTDINLGHVFALRPRANTSFRPNDFMAAKRALADERYTSVPEAARAVAEEALSLTRGDKTRIDPHPRR
jgi:hypothetical protein